MAYTRLLYHVVLRTKHSRLAINEENERAFYTFVLGYMRNHDYTLVRIGGMPDHVHLLVGLPPTVGVATFVHDLKISTNVFFKQHNKEFPFFEGWTRSYAAFTCSAKDKAGVVEYIKTQKEHHSRTPLADELRRLLAENGVEYNEKYLLDD
ncbi:MAG: IS200/IS605 family transposase [Bacteroidaceae bacterium]|nr:IS200/IS605 family transposase [Bacteroidaceae bacterium]